MNAPLEQFHVIAIFPIKILGCDLSFTNVMVIQVLIMLGLFIVYFLGTGAKHTRACLSDYLNMCSKYVTEVSYELTADLIPQRNQKYLPIVTALYFFIFFSNLIGLIPYTFTLTSHLIITFSIALTSFIGMNIIAVKRYGLRALTVFLPGNTPLPLALLLAPIEIISYFTKPISLGLRLFINLMAGHTLLKVIVGFAWSILAVEASISPGFIFPMSVLILLFVLELGVSLIQTYVFIVLTCIYIQDIS